MSSYDDMILAESGIVQYITCGDPSGTTATDSASSPHNGTYAGTFTVNQASILPAYPSDKSVNLNGGAITVAHNAALDLGDTWSFEFWLKRSTIGVLQTIYCPSVAGQELYLKIENTNLFTMRKVGVANLVTTTAALTDTSAGHHIVFVKSTSTRREIWLDGVNQTVTDGGNQTFSASTDNNDLMHDGQNVDPVLGNVSKIARYSTALSGARILAHYNAGINGITSSSPTPGMDPFGRAGFFGL